MTLIHKYGMGNVLRALVLTVVFLFAGACSNADDPAVPTGSNEAYWKISSTVSAAQGSSAIIISGVPGTVWSAEVTEGAGWCAFSSRDYSVSTKEGVVVEGLNVLYVYYKANTTGVQRHAQLSFTFAGEAAQTFDLSQLAASQQNLPHFGVWAELPDSKESANYQYASHYADLNKKTIRNFSLCFDKTKKAALWVAYPIHSIYLNGSGERTDAWAFDPIISSTFQANCVDRSYGGNYDRGHQLPSADRLATNEFNAQTFYMSNMTPQLDQLNQRMWAKLEGKVRTYSCSDTLYVVTGAHFGAGAATTTDGAGNTVPIPTNYYKVLLRTKAGNIGKPIRDCSDSELISIGFWVEQKSYGNIDPPQSICMTVADIEAKTGFTFFPQVSNAVKQQNRPVDWGIK